MEELPISPLRAVGLVSLPLSRKHDRAMIACPHCGEAMYLAPSSFVCENILCGFRRGSPADLLALVTGGYREAVELLKAEHPGLVSGDRSLVPALRARRRFLDFLREIKLREGDGAAERVALTAFFNGQAGLPDRVSNGSQLFLTSRETNELILLFDGMELDFPPGLQDRPCAMTVFWANHHAPAGLLLNARGASGVTGCRITRSRVGWFGLSDIHPALGAADIHPTPVDAMRYGSADNGRADTSVTTNLSHPLFTSPFERLRFRSVTGQLARILGLWSHVPGFEDATFVTEQGELGLRDMLLAVLKDAGERVFVDLAGTLSLPEKVSLELLDLTAGSLRRDRWGELRERLSRRMLDHVDRTTFYSGLSGYEAESAKGSTLLSNFTVRVSEVVAFQNSGEVHYNGRTAVDGQEYDFSLPSKVFDNPDGLVSAIQEAQILAGGRSQLAEIYARADFKKVMGLVKRMASKAPRIRGVKQLGWGWKYDRFTLPGLQVTATAADGDIRYFPGGDDYHCFQSVVTPSDVPEHPPGMGAAAYEVLCHCMSHMVRAYHHLPYSPLPVRNSEEGRHIARLLFAGFGQTAPLRPSNILPANLGLNNGMPCLSSGLNPLQTAKVRLAGVHLSDNGADLSTVTEEEAKAVAAVFPSLVASAAALLINEQLVYSERRSVDRINARLLEGAAILRDNFWPGWGAAPEAWKAVDAVLEKRRDELAREILRQEGRERFRLGEELWGGTNVDPDDLVIDLGLLGMKVNREDGAIEVEQNLFRRALTDFYGDLPQPA